MTSREPGVAFRDGHGSLSMDDLLDLGCSCEFGCLQCDEPLARMGNCPGWNDCPVGRKPDPDCRLSMTPETKAALQTVAETTVAELRERFPGYGEDVA